MPCITFERECFDATPPPGKVGGKLEAPVLMTPPAPICVTRWRLGQSGPKYVGAGTLENILYDAPRKSFYFIEDE